MLDFNKMNGLVPAIIQDAETAKVLMLGYTAKPTPSDKTLINMSDFFLIIIYFSVYLHLKTLMIHHQNKELWGYDI